MPSKIPPVQPPGCEELFSSIKKPINQFAWEHELEVTEYAPMVEHIIATRSRDVQYIENTLDSTLNFACHPDGLILFKSLCRYYYTIDPNATADYVRYYREMWEEDAVEEEGGS